MLRANLDTRQEIAITANRFVRLYYARMIYMISWALRSRGLAANVAIITQLGVDEIVVKLAGLGVIRQNVQRFALRGARASILK